MVRTGMGGRFIQYFALAEGGVIEVKHQGTIFNVTKTIQS